MSARWQFWIDRGGTFTDCIALDPHGALHSAKVLSSARAPAQVIQKILTAAGEGADALKTLVCDVKLGTTVATNALLERRGARTVFVTQRGFEDLLRIGTQQRPALFELEIKKPAPLHERTLELPGRNAADGSVLENFDAHATRRAFKNLRAEGIEAVAIAGLHATQNANWEDQTAAAAREAGFPMVTTSARSVGEVGLLARAETALADAYLTPLLRAHTRELARALPSGARLRFMQSSGGLTDAARFRGSRALLSGPAGGAVGAAHVAAQNGFARAIGFDMGGTSTDVCLIQNFETERAFESEVAGLRVRAPMLKIHTVAAGGGSLCRFDGFRLTVGPESAGAAPGPLCYGAAEARELALTDINAFLGRIRPERFSFPLKRERVGGAVQEMCAQLAAAGHARSAIAVAAGFIEIANAGMAEAIRQVSVSRGVDPRDFAIVGFGGAAGQHVCAVARKLGVRDVLLHPLAGLLSAYGIGVSETSWDGERALGAELRANGKMPAAFEKVFAALEKEGEHALLAEQVAREDLLRERRLDLRYRGAETALTVKNPTDGNWAHAFRAAHKARFGYTRKNHPIEAVTARVTLRARTREILKPQNKTSSPRAATACETSPHSYAEVWFPEVGRVRVPLFERARLHEGAQIEGPAVVLEDIGTVVIDPGFRASVGDGGVLHLRDEVRATQKTDAHKNNRELKTADPVRLEVFGNRFMSIAEQMGAVLRNTALSTNIKERLDYSCAVFDDAGGLVANAPHIPVHLGAMGATVRAVKRAIPDLRAGDAILTNDPAAGGSHLPDVTVVSPIFYGRALKFFVASRGHQADLGGIAPGSMPAHSTTLEEEGVVLPPFPLLRDGVFHEAALRARLTGARYPARAPDDNIADARALLAANQCGEALLRAMVTELGAEAVRVTMAQLQRAAADKVAREIARLGEGDHKFCDALDSGAKICARLKVENHRRRRYRRPARPVS